MQNEQSTATILPKNMSPLVFSQSEIEEEKQRNIKMENNAHLFGNQNVSSPSASKSQRTRTVAPKQISSFGTEYDSVVKKEEDGKTELATSDQVTTKTNNAKVSDSKLIMMSHSSFPVPIVESYNFATLMDGKKQKEEWQIICEKLKIREKPSTKGREFPFHLSYSCCGSTSRWHYGGNANALAKNCPAFGASKVIDLSDRDFAFLLHTSQDCQGRLQCGYVSDWENAVKGITKSQSVSNRKPREEMIDQVNNVIKQQEAISWSFVPQEKQKAYFIKEYTSQPHMKQEIQNIDFSNVVTKKGEKLNEKEKQDLSNLLSELKHLKEQNEWLMQQQKNTESQRGEYVERSRSLTRRKKTKGGFAFNSFKKENLSMDGEERLD